MPAFDFVQELRDVLERNAPGQRGGRPLAHESAHLDHQIWLHDSQPTEKEFGSARELFDVFAHGEGLTALQQVLTALEAQIYAKMMI